MEGSLLFQTALCQWEQRRLHTADPNNFLESGILNPNYYAMLVFTVSIISCVPDGTDCKLNIPPCWKPSWSILGHLEVTKQPHRLPTFHCQIKPCVPAGAIKTFKNCSYCLLHSAQVFLRVSIRCLESSRSHGGWRRDEVVIRKWD